VSIHDRTLTRTRRVSEAVTGYHLLADASGYYQNGTANRKKPPAIPMKPGIHNESMKAQWPQKQISQFAHMAYPI
jgi:hypothetical protein